MRDWIKRILGLPGDPQASPNEPVHGNYVVVDKTHLEAILLELEDLRSRAVSTDARELDLMVAELEQENRLLRARNERLEKESKATMNGRE